MQFHFELKKKKKNIEYYMYKSNANVYRWRENVPTLKDERIEKEQERERKGDFGMFDASLFRPFNVCVFKLMKNGPRIRGKEKE